LGSGWGSIDWGGGGQCLWCIKFLWHSDVVFFGLKPRGSAHMRFRGDGNMVHSDTVHNLQGQDLKGKDLVEDLGVDGAIRRAMCV